LDYKETKFLWKTPLNKFQKKYLNLGLLNKKGFVYLRADLRKLITE